MKKILVVLAIAFLAVPIPAHAKYCMTLSCNYVIDGSFTNGGADWVESSGVTYPNGNTCSTNTVAQIPQGGYVYQDFYVDESFTSFAVSFKAYLPNDSGNWYDQITITVTNLDTNVSESFTLNGASYDTNCNNNTYTLSNDYDYANVRVKVSVGTWGLRAWQADDVAFWARRY